MSLRDDLQQVTMTQTKDYNEESKEGNTAESVDNINRELLGESEYNDAIESRGNVESPFKDFNAKKIFIVVGVLVAVICISVSAYLLLKEGEQGADFLEDLEGEDFNFQYTLEERDLLRIYGFTADDIERYEAEESDPHTLVEQVELSRKELYDSEIKPYLDGASPQYKELEKLTWLGTGEMNPIILNSEAGTYEERYGTYNCDFIKIKPMGSQLFLKLDLPEFNTSVFMNVSAERYNQLTETGNIVVIIEYNKYSNESILVTNVQEKDITS